VKLLTDLQILGCKLHKNGFGGRALFKKYGYSSPAAKPIFVQFTAQNLQICHSGVVSGTTVRALVLGRFNEKK